MWENIWNRRIQVSNLGQGRIATTAPFAILSFGCGGKAIGQRTHGSINNSPHPAVCPSIGRWSRARPRSRRRCQIVQKKYFFSDLVLRAGLNVHHINSDAFLRHNRQYKFTIRLNIETWQRYQKYINRCE